jgi:hypothetical protein
MAQVSILKKLGVKHGQIICATRSLFRVNRVILPVGRLLPVFPWKRTSSGPVAMSQRCQEETPALQKRCGDSTNDEAAN